MRLPLCLALVAALAAGCDSGTDTLVLDGTFQGSGQSQVATGADPLVTTLDVEVTFDAAGPGAIAADLGAVVTVLSPEAYSGRATGTLGADGAVSLSATLSQTGVASGGGLLFTFQGQATESRIEGDVSGSLPINDFVLTRR